MTAHETPLAGYPSLTHPEDKGILVKALILAVALHAVFLLISLPEPTSPIEPSPASPEPPTITNTPIPPPPLPEERVFEFSDTTRRIPVPDPVPDAPEPVREAAPVLDVSAPTVDTDVFVADLAPPPASVPMIPGTGGVRPPVLIEETKVRPVYPELARVARIRGDVILQAVILKDGTVGEIRILRCLRPSLGFEEAAIEAVQQWRYEPATRSGKPVDVYFTVHVIFELQ